MRRCSSFRLLFLFCAPLSLPLAPSLLFSVFYSFVLSFSLPTLLSLFLNYIFLLALLLTRHILSSLPYEPPLPPSQTDFNRLTGEVIEGRNQKVERTRRAGREGERQRGDFRGCLLLWRPSGTKCWAIGVPGHGSRYRYTERVYIVYLENQIRPSCICGKGPCNSLLFSPRRSLTDYGALPDCSPSRSWLRGK